MNAHMVDESRLLTTPIPPTEPATYKAAWNVLQRHDAADLADALGIPKEDRR